MTFDTFVKQSKQVFFSVLIVLARKYNQRNRLHTHKFIKYSTKIFYLQRNKPFKRKIKKTRK